MACKQFEAEKGEARLAFMLIDYLKEYLELVSTMNYTSAARRLNITQSALSKHIAALEKEFGTTFIDRSKQQIELTQQGRVFCEEASKILDAYQMAQHRLGLATGEIRIAGALRDSAVHNIQSRAQDILRERGQLVQTVSHEYPLGTVIDALKEGKIDLVIDIMVNEGVSAAVDNQVDVRFLTAVPLLAVVSRNNEKLGSCESITIEELAEERIMHPTGSMHIQNGSTIIESIFEGHGVKLRKRIFFANSWNDFPTVDLENDVFIMPRSLYSRQLFGSQLFDALHSIPIADDDARFPYGISYRRGENDAGVLRYIDALVEAARQLDG